MKAGSGADVRPVYAATKFTQLLAANWWRRQLAGKCNVVAVSPGLIPGTGLAKGLGLVSPDMPDAKPVPEGKLNPFFTPLLFPVCFVNLGIRLTRCCRCAKYHSGP